MNVQERLGRRKEEARAGLEAARGKTAAPPPIDAAAIAAFAKSLESRPCVLKGEGADALAAKTVIQVSGKREGGRDVAVGEARFDNPVVIENAPGPLWLTAAALLGHPVKVPETGDFPLRLGALIAGLARGGADKLTLLPSTRLKSIGPFVQRLLENTIVIDGEPKGKKADYAVDRFFISVALASEEHDMTYLAEAGHPVVQWKLDAPDEIGAEIVRWYRVKALLDDLLPKSPAVEGVAMPAEPSLRAKGLALFTPPEHAYVLRKAAGTLGEQAAVSPAAWIAAHLALADAGEYVALGAWLPHETEDDLSQVQGAIRNVTRVACTRSYEYVRPDPRAMLLLLTAGQGAPNETFPAGRALRIHTEDGDPAKIVESLREATKMLSRK